MLRSTIGKTAVLATAGCAAALALAGPASAGVYDKHLAQDCPQPYSQHCSPSPGVAIQTTTGNLFVTFTADGNPPACAPGRARILLDGKEWGSHVVQPGENDGGYGINTSPGSHVVAVQMEGVLGGCNTGQMSGWSGNLHVATDADAANGAG